MTTTTHAQRPHDDWLTLQQVAERLGVALVTVKKWWRDGEFYRLPPGEPDTISTRASRGAGTGYNKSRGGRMVNTALLDTFVPPSQRLRATIAAAGRLTADEAAAFIGRSTPHLNRAAHVGDLPFVLIDGVRAFDRADLETWRDMPTPTGRPRRSLDSARNKAVRAGPLLSLSDAWRLLGFADRASITRLVQRGRLPVVFDEQGHRRVNRTDVEALAAERAARKAKRAEARR
ncbi:MULTISPECIES: hypothetical protein [Burkholderia]|uniref:hypothetical protein n=1 Tax=Burkholderia TaxID=32008 RepID=UPI0021503EA6|nr:MULTISPECIES: hypothetical protein [Burkholderia]MDR5643232.1 hypothetical protein [Burkholderia cenocepacia]UVS97377.1 hypothetical protein EFP19_17595 [Burkholderia glumae]